VKYFLDSDICIYYLNGMYPDIVTHLIALDAADVKIASVVAAEVYYGARKSRRKDANRRHIDEFFKSFEIIPFDHDASEYYAMIRADMESRGEVIGANDYLVAATALSRGGKLVTNNMKEFMKVPGLAVENWVRPRYEAE
jgi:tRNA(fMet)-specific endonuclease VapC